MNAALRRPMTVDKFLAWEERQELRYEFDGFRVLAMILGQTHAAALVFSRRGELWTAETVTGEGAVLAMPEIGIEVALAEIYEGVGVESDDDDGASV